MVEQGYSVSRSRSGGGVKILVEVSLPDTSPGKVNNDTIVIITAKFESLEEETAGEHFIFMRSELNGEMLVHTCYFTSLSSCRIVSMS